MRGHTLLSNATRALRITAIAGAWLAVSGCYSTNSYLLKLDAQDQSKSQLCEQTSNSDRQTCSPLAGQGLEAPGVLAVEIVNSSGDKSYGVRLEN